MSRWYSYLIGLDLGQAADYSALSLIEQQIWIPDAGTWASPTNMTVHQMNMAAFRQGILPTDRPLHVRHLERYPLNTPYPAIVRDVAARVLELRDKGVALLIDATGVGRPVLDMFRAAGLKPIGITITGGDASSRDGDLYRVPKRELVSSLQVALQREQLKISSALVHAADFQREALNFKVSISLGGHDSYGAWRESVHDDLVLSVAMATWFAGIKQPSKGAYSWG